MDDSKKRKLQRARSELEGAAATYEEDDGKVRGLLWVHGPEDPPL